MTASINTRGRSAPATTPQSQSISRSNTIKPLITTALIAPSSSSFSSSIIPIPINGPLAATINGDSPPRPFADADAVARITVELNVRTVSAQTERLEEELAALAEYIEADKEFREKHDKRLQNLCNEILAVKQRVVEIQGPEWNEGGGGGGEKAEAGQKEVDEAVERLRREMGEMRGLVSDMSSALDKLPTAAEAEALVRRSQAPASASNGDATQAPAIDKASGTSKQPSHHLLRLKDADKVPSSPL
jgi:hypothetical protein